MKTSKLRVTGLCAGNSPETGEFPAQMASYAENVSIWWRHHVSVNCVHEYRDVLCLTYLFIIVTINNILLRYRRFPHSRYIDDIDISGVWGTVQKFWHILCQNNASQIQFSPSVDKFDDDMSSQRNNQRSISGLSTLGSDPASRPQVRLPGGHFRWQLLSSAGGWM